MDEKFAVYVDRLRNGAEQAIHEELSPDFLEVGGHDVVFQKSVKIEGKAYLAESELVVEFYVSAFAELPCIICGCSVEHHVCLDPLYLSPEKSEYKSGIYNFKERLREEIILELPKYKECHNGKCPERKDIEKFMKQSGADSDPNASQSPFAELL